MAARLCALALLACVCTAAYGQSGDAVTVTALRDPVDKSYRRMVEGLELFEKRRALAPGAQLRFRLLPRKKATSMQDVDVAIVADTFETPLEVASDGTFALPRDRKALRENASVRPNRKKQTMTWRADIRTPGLPPGTRRETLSVDRLYGGATRDPRWKETLRYCDCEVLLDRTYFMPLGDRTGREARAPWREQVLLFSRSGELVRNRILAGP